MIERGTGWGWFHERLWKGNEVISCMHALDCICFLGFWMGGVGDMERAWAHLAFREGFGARAGKKQLEIPVSRRLLGNKKPNWGFLLLLFNHRHFIACLVLRPASLGCSERSS